MIQANLEGKEADLSQNGEEDQEAVGAVARGSFTHCDDCGISAGGYRDMFRIYDQEDTVYCRRCLTDPNYQVHNKEVFLEQ